MGSVASATYANVTRYPSFSNFGAGKLILMIHQLEAYNAGNVGGLTVSPRDLVVCPSLARLVMHVFYLCQV